jgi:hypothetical protein
MSVRPASGLLISAMIRRVEAAGGHAMVLAKGDATAGAILLVIADRGRIVRVMERMLGLDEVYRWNAAGPADPDEPQALADYIARRRRNDPDLWVVELDSPDAEQIAAELI